MKNREKKMGSFGSPDPKPNCGSVRLRRTLLPTEPWYKNGLRFQCQRCGNCCGGEPGYIWVSPKEIRAISLYLGLQVEEFARRYLKKIGNRFSLRELLGGDCIMYKARSEQSESDGCQIYPARPRQCSTFPFWHSNLKSREAWADLKKFCNGVDKGPLYPLSTIQQIISGQAAVESRQ